MNPDATYKFVDIIEVPTDEIEYTTEDDILDDSNWPPPIPVNGPNSNLNMGGLLNSIPWKPLEEKNSAYSRDFGTFIGRFRPKAHSISGLVRMFKDTNRKIRRVHIQYTSVVPKMVPAAAQ